MSETIIERVIRTTRYDDPESVIVDKCPRDFGYKNIELTDGSRCYYNSSNCKECWNRIIEEE